jgi:hypothetical protein
VKGKGVVIIDAMEESIKTFSGVPQKDKKRGLSLPPAQGTHTKVR